MNIKTLNGTYAAAKFDDETLNAIEELQRRLRLINPVARDDLHCTIAYSRKNIAYKPASTPGEIGVGKELKIWDTKSGRTLVLLLDSPYLMFRHEYSMRLGGTYDFPDYIPHITLSYDLGPQEIKVENVDAKIKIALSYEYVEELDLEK